MPRAFSLLAALGLALLAVLTSPAHAEKRVALVIGNDKYANMPPERQLQKAVNDAEAVGDALGRLGFEVIRGRNLGRQGMIDSLSELTSRLQPGDTAVFFFAGHGVAVGGVNYLVPSDVPRVTGDSESRVRGASIAEADVVQEIQSRGVRVALLVLDACRDNPFPRTGGRSIGNTRGLADARPARGVFTIYSAGIGQEALDRLEPNEAARNSVFTRVFVEHLTRPGLHLSDLAVEVREQVAALALKAKNDGGRPAPHEQTPAYYDQTIGGRVYLAGAPAAAIAPQATAVKEQAQPAGRVAAAAPAADPAGDAVRRGRALLRQQNLAGARAAFSEAIRIDPNFAEAYVGRAAATPIQATGDHKSVRADLDRAIRVDPYLAGAYAARAELRSEWENDKPGALQDYGKAIEMAPRDPLLRIKRALFLDDQAQLDPALADLSEAVRFDPRNVAALSIRAAVLDRKGEIDRAIADYGAAIRLSTVFGGSGGGFASEAELAAANDATAGDDAAIRELIRLDGLYKSRAGLLRKKGLPAQAAADEAAAKRVPQKN